MFQGAKVPGSESSWNFRSREQKFQELSFLAANVPRSESSWERKFFRSRERKFHTMELYLLGAKVLRGESSCYRVANVGTGGKMRARVRKLGPQCTPIVGPQVCSSVVRILPHPYRLRTRQYPDQRYKALRRYAHVTIYLQFHNSLSFQFRIIHLAY